MLPCRSLTAAFRNTYLLLGRSLSGSLASLLLCPRNVALWFSPRRHVHLPCTTHSTATAQYVSLSDHVRMPPLLAHTCLLILPTTTTPPSLPPPRLRLCLCLCPWIMISYPPVVLLPSFRHAYPRIHRLRIQPTLLVQFILNQGVSLLES